MCWGLFYSPSRLGNTQFNVKSVLFQIILCQGSWQYFLYLVQADLVFLLARFLLYINSSNYMRFPLNQSSCFLTAVLNFSLDTLQTIDLKVFHFSSTIPTGISVRMPFSNACSSSLTLLIICPVSYEIPDWHFVFPHSMLYS